MACGVCVSVRACVRACVCVCVHASVCVAEHVGLHTNYDLYHTAGYTALHWATLGGVKASIKCLVKKNADLNKKDKQVSMSYFLTCNVKQYNIMF